MQNKLGIKLDQSSPVESPSLGSNAAAASPSSPELLQLPSAQLASLAKQPLESNSALSNALAPPVEVDSRAVPGMSSLAVDVDVASGSALRGPASSPQPPSSSSVSDQTCPAVSSAATDAPFAPSRLQPSSSASSGLVEHQPTKAAAPQVPIRRRNRNALHLAIVAGSPDVVQQLLHSNPEYLNDVDHEGHTPVSLSLHLVNSAVGAVLRTAGLSRHRHISELSHGDSFRKESLDSSFQICKLLSDYTRRQKEWSSSLEHVSRHRRSFASACFSDISSILSRNMTSFQESQWRTEQRNLALRLSSTFKSRCFRRNCSKRASDRRRALAQTLIACAFRVHRAKFVFFCKRGSLNTQAAIRIHNLFFRHKIRRSKCASAALTIQSAWRHRVPHRAMQDLKRALHQRLALLQAHLVLSRLFKFFAARLALSKARKELIHRLKMAEIAEQNAKTGSFAIRLQSALRCSCARKVFSQMIRQRVALQIQCCYRAHLARSSAASASADESALAAFKSGYCFSIFGVSGFVPMMRINLGGYVARCTAKLQRAWRGRSARLLVARMDLQRVHASARTVQFIYARHFHFDW